MGMLLLALGHLMWTSEYPALRAAPDTALLAFSLQALAVVLFSCWPFLARASLAGEQWAWRAAALAGPAWFLSLKRLFEVRFGSEAIALLPIALAGLSLGAAFRAREQGLLDTAMRKRGLVWFSGAAMGFLSIAIPLQLEEEWITLGWALQGLALTALWKRLDHAGLKYFGLTLLAVVTVRLVANPQILDYHPSSSVPIFNWLMYTYLIPAAALLGSAWNLHELELKRLLEWEEADLREGSPARGHQLQPGGDLGRICLDQPDDLRFLLDRISARHFFGTHGGEGFDPVAGLGRLRAAPSRHRRFPQQRRAAMDQPQFPGAHHRQGLPARSRQTRGPLSRRVPCRPGV